MTKIFDRDDNYNSSSKFTVIGFFISITSCCAIFIYPYFLFVLPLFISSGSNVLELYFLNFNFSNSTFYYASFTDTYYKRNVLADQDSVGRKFDYSDNLKSEWYSKNYMPLIYLNSNEENEQEISKKSSFPPDSFTGKPYEIIPTELGIFDVYQFGLTSWYKWNLDSNGKKINVTKGLNTLLRGLTLNEELNKDLNQKNYTIYIDDLYWNYNSWSGGRSSTSHLLGVANNILKCLFPLGISFLGLLFISDCICFYLIRSYNRSTNFHTRLQFYIPLFVSAIYITYVILISASSIGYQQGIAGLHSTFKTKYSKSLQGIMWASTVVFIIRFFTIWTYRKQLPTKI